MMVRSSRSPSCTPHSPHQSLAVFAESLAQPVRDFAKRRVALDRVQNGGQQIGSSAPGGFDVIECAHRSSIVTAGAQLLHALDLSGLDGRVDLQKWDWLLPRLHVSIDANNDSLSRFDLLLVRVSRILNFLLHKALLDGAH